MTTTYTTTFFALMLALKTGSEIEFGGTTGRGIIHSLSREDGSGKTWNVVLTNARKVFVRTID